MTNRCIKAVFFDFMGTCLDWHTGVVKIFPQSIEAPIRSEMALKWRQKYFDSNSARLQAGQQPEDIDLTLRRTLQMLLEEYLQYRDLFNEHLIAACVAQWHSMPAWPEVPRAVQALQNAGYETFVFANGTTRLQLDLCRSSGLHFDMLFSSALLGVYKPAQESYRKVLELVKLRPEETVQVAAHANDLGGARKAGMRTVYVDRWTDDIVEDKEVIRKENEHFLKDMKLLPEVIAEMQID